MYKPPMLQRVGYGILAIAVLVLLVVQDVAIARYAARSGGAFGELLARGSLIPLFFIVVLLRGSMELARILRAKGAQPYVAWANISILFLALAPWFSAAGWFGSGVAEQEGLLWQIVGVAGAFVGAGVLTILGREPHGTVRDLGATMLMVLYLGLLAGFGTMLRCGKDVPGHEGAWLLLLVLLITKVSDIGAYFTGKAIGRHKLIPTISPGKSVEGAIGGILASAGVAALFAALPSMLPPAIVGEVQRPFLMLLHDATHSISLASDPAGMSPIVRALIIGALLSVAGQFGDLIESCFKRDGGVKDSGHLLPQYGGILDLVDSPLYAMPVAWFLLRVVWKIA